MIKRIVVDKWEVERAEAEAAAHGAHERRAETVGD